MGSIEVTTAVPRVAVGLRAREPPLVTAAVPLSGDTELRRTPPAPEVPHQSPPPSASPSLVSGDAPRGFSHTAGAPPAPLLQGEAVPRVLPEATGAPEVALAVAPPVIEVVVTPAEGCQRGASPLPPAEETGAAPRHVPPRGGLHAPSTFPPLGFVNPISSSQESAETTPHAVAPSRMLAGPDAGRVTPLLLLPPPAPLLLPPPVPGRHGADVAVPPSRGVPTAVVVQQPPIRILPRRAARSG